MSGDHTVYCDRMRAIILCHQGGGVVVVAGIHQHLLSGSSSAAAVASEGFSEGGNHCLV